MSDSAPSVSLRKHSLSAAFRQALFWAVMFGGGEASFVLFATWLGAPTLLFGLLAGLPSLLGPLAQVVAANLLDRYGKRMPLVLWPVLIQALLFFPLALLPFLGKGNLTYALFMAAIAIYFVVAHLAHPPWYSLIGDLVPAGERGNYFARLTRIPTFIALVAQLGVGAALFWVSDPQLQAWVFAISFLVAGTARLISYSIVCGVREPAYRARAEDLFTFWQFIRRAKESNFVKFVIFTGLFYFGAHIVGPYFVPYFTYKLGYQTYHWVILTALGTLSSIVTMLAWGKFSDRFGSKRAIQVSALLASFVPGLWLLTENFPLLVLINMLGASSWAGLQLGSWNYIMEAVSAPKRARCVAYFNIIAGLGVFFGAAAGEGLHVWLPETTTDNGSATSFPYMLIASAAFRLGVCLLFLPMFRELRKVEDFSLPRWFFTVTQMRSVYGIFINVFAERDEQDGDDKNNSRDTGPQL